MLIIETEAQLEDALSAPNAADVDFMIVGQFAKLSHTRNCKPVQDFNEKC